jgi:redox-sensitive bicupin YhaK (pirin superfamily)
MKEVIRDIAPLHFPWVAADPFLFCVHHDDAYPAGNSQLGPAASLAGRPIGQDFSRKDGWSMYHGQVVPGFPQHPHRGFETVTIVRRGFIDHSDSLGATARFGAGDVQWLTAGGGIVHAEMFPLLHKDGPNPVELFQIWLNLPAASKMVKPYFTMLWNENIRQYSEGGAVVRVVAGSLGEAHAPSPPPNSWAASPDGDVAIWTLALAAGARWTLPAARPGTNRTLYFFKGGGLAIGGMSVGVGHAIFLRADAEAVLENGDQPSELLLLQGRPIGEPVAARGPFVMNTREELMLAYSRLYAASDRGAGRAARGRRAIA